jgi:ribosomal-protein-alanine N-acetyltransferase
MAGALLEEPAMHPSEAIEALRIAHASPAEEAAAAALVRDTGMQVDVAAELGRRFARLWLAWLPGRGDPAGFLLAWHVVDELHVIDLATHPDLRRRGIARALVNHAVAHAVSQRARMALLEVSCSNAPAIALYSSLGFFQTNLRRGYYANGEDAIEMALELPVADLPPPGPLHPET